MYYCSEINKNSIKYEMIFVIIAMAEKTNKYI